MVVKTNVRSRSNGNGRGGSALAEMPSDDRSLALFVAAMKHMSDAHNAGDIDVIMPVEQFHGEFRTMAEGVNDMVAQHINVKKKAIACIVEFGNGNFDAPLEKFPGKKVFVNNAIEQLRGNLKFFIESMRSMSDGHNAGDIDVVIPEDKFQGDYRLMAHGVNDMVAQHIAVKKKAIGCIAQFGEGNFNAPLETFPGKKVFVNNAIEQLRGNLKFFIESMRLMSDGHNAGDIDVVMPEDKFHGDYRLMAHGVNDMVAQHINVKKKAMACFAEFGKGNFDAVIEKFPGKKAFINDTVEQVRSNLKELLRAIAQMN
jgi:methyl-accepting chemotaxis protein